MSGEGKMRVLVLCHGNLNRSPFVAALIRRWRPRWTVTSAGLKTTPGRRASRKAREAALSRGMDLGDHLSMPLTKGMVDFNDVILYMDGGNEKRLRVFLAERYTELHASQAWVEKCRLLAGYGSLRRVPDPNYTSDPEKLREYFGIAETCTMKFLEAHPA